ncbi:putative carbonic anhydrase-like protein 1 [Mya arenaria]|uniref:putative carbonic anhydrase-like protein 1 n=1 Tax=Mya arenaria TaxID=6604 RepID=UPI0022E19EBB|nr:putative carbonic anhydrase-like protein 1 [Mya arenaria]
MKRDLWEEWWGYGSGTSGPAFWGRHEKLFALCSMGRFQSPIDIRPETLIYDPNLTTIKFQGNAINGTLHNTVHDLTLDVNYTDTTSGQFNFSSGPFSYTYRLFNVKLHLGIFNDVGSEHTIAGKQFPIEIQLMGFNSDLYRNHSEATMSTHGLAIISVLGSIDEMFNLEFDKVLTAVKNMSYKGEKQLLKNFNMLDIIPRSEMFITYEGSLTQPSCQETVTWAIVNKPMRITKHQMASLRELNQWREGRPSLQPNNFRPPLPFNRRPVRINISPHTEAEDCAMKITKSYTGS